MKRFISIVCLVLAMGGCASTGGGKVNKAWNNAMSFGDTSIDGYNSLYRGYTPNYDEYTEISLDEAFGIVESRGNFDGYFFTKNLVVLDKINTSTTNRFSVIPLERIRTLEKEGRFRNASDLAKWISYSVFSFDSVTSQPVGNNIQRQPESFSIVTIWYRGLSRTSSYTHKGMFVDKFEVTGQFTRELNDTEKAEAERRATPRYSPEEQEYKKMSLTEAVGQTRNSANRGKTLFFESQVTMERGAMTGQYHVSSLESSGITLMEYYGQLPMILLLSTILYRAEVSSIGTVRFVIDSFKE